MKKVIIFSLTFLLVFSLVPEISFSQTDNEMLHFVATVKWGNVQGEVQDKTQTNFDGSITTSSVSTARVSLIRTLLFEKHNETADKITSKTRPVSWNSLIYDHWDGVRVLISAHADNTIAINTTQGNVIKTARELYNADSSGAPIVQDVGDGKEIVIKTHPVKKRQFFLGILWGATGRTEYVDNTARCVAGAEGTARCPLPKKDFKGYFKIDSGGSLKLMRTIRFEPEHGDKITSQTRSQINWDSFIYGGIDGILVKLDLNQNVSNNDTVTIAFTSDDTATGGWQKSFSIIDVYHDRVTEESITTGYGLLMKVWRRSNGSLLRAKDSAGVYKIEDDTKRPIPSPEVFNSHGFDWSEIEEVDQEELDDYAEGDVLGYPDGSLIQGSGPVVYALSEGKKRPFVSAQAFSDLGYKWGLIKKVDNSHLNLYDNGDPITENSSHPDGALIRVEGENTVYRIEGGKRKPVPSPEVFNANKWGWNYVLEVKAQHRNRLSQGDNVNYLDGSLISAPDGKVYKIDKGEKRWVRSADDFNNAGFNWAKITPVSNIDINVFGEGEDVVGEDFGTSD